MKYRKDKYGKDLSIRSNLKMVRRKLQGPVYAVARDVGRKILKY